MWNSETKNCLVLVESSCLQY